MQPSLSLCFRLPMWVLLASLWLGVGACQKKESFSPQLKTFEESHMGTLFTIRVWVTQQGMVDDLTLLSQRAFDRIREIEEVASDYIPESELNRLAISPTDFPIPLSEDLYQLLALCENLYRETNGRFDPTIAPMIRLWRLSRKNRQLPSPQQISSARSRSGFSKLKIDHHAKSLTKTVEDMRFDLGGIAKGYAADAAYQILKEGGFPRALVAASGDIRLGDPPPGKSGWRIGFETLQIPEDLKQLPRLNLANCAISTSGDTRQYIEIEGTRYSHILDPQTGLGLTERIAVTVIAPDATTSDSYATSISLLGEKQGLKFAENKRGVECQISTIREGTEETFSRSHGFSKFADSLATGKEE